MTKVFSKKSYIRIKLALDVLNEVCVCVCVHLFKTLNTRLVPQQNAEKCMNPILFLFLNITNPIQMTSQVNLHWQRIDIHVVAGRL